MTITLVQSGATLAVEVRDAVDLGGGAVELRLPESCSFVRLLPGTLLEAHGSPLALGGPRADGSILAASVLPRGADSASGSGTLLALALEGAGCANASTLLRATAYDAEGVGTEMPIELPGTGSAFPLPLLGVASLLALLVRSLRARHP